MQNVFRKGSNKNNKSLATMTSIFIYSMFCFFPLFYTNKFYNITGSKLGYFLVSFFVWLFLLFLFFNNPERVENDKPLWKRITLAEYGIMAYMIVLLLSALLSDSKKIAFMGNSVRNEGLIVQYCYALTFLLLSKLYRFNRNHLLGFGIVAIIVSIIGIINFNGIDILHMFPGDQMKAQSMITTLGNVNVVSTYACFPIIIFGILFIKDNSKFQYFYLISSLFAFYLVLVARSDSGYVGLLAAGILAFPFLFDSAKSTLKVFIIAGLYLLMLYLYTSAIDPSLDQSIIFGLNFGTTYLVAMVALFIVGIALFYIIKALSNKMPGIHIKPAYLYISYFAILIIAFVIVAGYAREYITEGSNFPLTAIEAANVLRGEMNYSMGSFRGFIWLNSLKIAGIHPILGWGPDNFNTAFNTYFKAESAARYNVFFDKAHNEYLQALICTGFLGLISYFVFMIGIVYMGLKKYKNNIVFACFIAIACYFVQAFFNINVPIVAPYLWIFCGIMGSAYRNAPENE